MEKEKIMVLDTETTNFLEEPIIYDIGFSVIDTFGKVYENHSYVIADTFLDEDFMNSAYYIEKVPKYWEGIKKGERKLRKLATVHNILYDVCRKYNIKKIYAHNALFDWKSCTITERYLTSSKYRYFFPYGVELHDTLKMARQVFGKDNDYKAWCKENDFICKNKQVRLNAETLYRYISNNLDFVESHTGLEDVEIEKEILLYCLRAEPNVQSKLFKD